MGGPGSGPRWWNGTKKPLVEDCWALDTTFLRRWGALAPGAVRAGQVNWYRGNQTEPTSTIGYRVETTDPDDSRVWLEYKLVSTGEEGRYAVRLATTPCHLGGARGGAVVR